MYIFICHPLDIGSGADILENIYVKPHAVVVPRMMGGAFILIVYST
jgi:hypothetical protein